MAKDQEKCLYFDSHVNLNRSVKMRFEYIRTSPKISTSNKMAIMK
jgi:hypothetical protein